MPPSAQVQKPLTDECLLRAFQAIKDKLSLEQILLLQHHYLESRVVTVTELSSLVGCDNPIDVADKYRAVARMLAEEMGLAVDSDELLLLCTFARHPTVERGERLLVMRPAVSKALVRLGWCRGKSLERPETANDSARGD